MRGGLGNPVPLVSLQLRESSRRELYLISVARVSLSFGERLMPEHGHDLVGAAPGFGEAAPGCLPQSVRTEGLLICYTLQAVSMFKMLFSAGRSQAASV